MVKVWRDCDAVTDGLNDDALNERDIQSVFLANRAGIYRLHLADTLVLAASTSYTRSFVAPIEISDGCCISMTRSSRHIFEHVVQEILCRPYRLPYRLTSLPEYHHIYHIASLQHLLIAMPRSQLIQSISARLASRTKLSASALSS